MMDSKIKQYWEQFIKDTHQPDLKFGSAWAFGMTKDQADNLAKLTYEGVKTATSSLYELYKLENDPLPIANEHYDVLLDGTGNPVGIILTTDVTIQAYDKVSEQHAYEEGEGDRTLEYWRQVHDVFFTKALAEVGVDLDLKDAHVVLEKLQLVYREALRVG